MKHNRKITPEGMKDILLEECALRRALQQKLEALFQQSGYREVVTPGIEFYDLFDPAQTGIPQESLYKMTDNKGRLLVVRPDCTLPIARLTATRLQALPKPLRLYYDQTVYCNNPGLTGRDDEQLQCGIELLGAGGMRADLEAMFLASQAMERIAPDYRIEIGHAAFFRALADELPVQAEDREAIRRAIEAKNYSSLSAMLDTLPDSPAVHAVKLLPRLFGGQEVLEQARELCRSEKAAQTLSDLKELYEKLCALGLQGHIMIDLGLVQRNDYYTGVVFRAYLPQCGDAVLSGGRYDSLLNWFDQPMPAIGFALNVDAITGALLREGEEGETAPDLLVHGAPGYETQALSYMRERMEKGEKCEYSVFETEEEARAYAAACGIARLAIVGRETERQEVTAG